MRGRRVVGRVVAACALLAVPWALWQSDALRAGRPGGDGSGVAIVGRLAQAAAEASPVPMIAAAGPRGQRARPGGGPAARGPTASPPLRDSGGGAVGLERLQVVRAALQAISYPDKGRVAELAETLGRRYQRRFLAYEFLPSGSLFSPSVRDVTDMDLFFNSSESGLVSSEEFDELQKVAGELFELKVQAVVFRRGGVVFRGANLSMARDGVAKGADVVVLKGHLGIMDGWRVPMDLSLRRGGGVLSASACLQDIRMMLALKFYDGVVSRMRNLLPEDRKEAYDAGWSEAGGRIRFLVTQLGQLKYMSDSQASRYIEEKLKLPGEHGPRVWTTIAKKEMMRVALAFLLDTRALYADVLERVAPDVVTWIEAGQAGLNASSASRAPR